MATEDRIDVTKEVQLRGGGPHTKQISIFRHTHGTHTLAFHSYAGSYMGFDVQLSPEEFRALHEAMGEVLAVSAEPDVDGAIPMEPAL